MTLALYLIHASKITGSEFVALLTLGLLASVLIAFSDKIQAFTLAGNVVQLKHENERAESNIEKMNELASAIADSLIIASPGLYEDHFETGYREGIDFVNRYRLYYELQSNGHFPQEKIELAVRKYLHDTGIGVRYQAMYDCSNEIPSPSQLLDNFSQGSQRASVSQSPYFQFYQKEIYPLYVVSVSRNLKNNKSPDK